MEKLSKIAIYIAIAVGISFFILFLIIALPHMIQDSERQWREAFGPKISPEDLRAMFYETDSYKTFLEKYPNAGEYFQPHSNGGRMEITVMNFQTYNTLLLELDYNNYDASIREEVSCFNYGTEMHHQVRGTLAKQFIEESRCLEGDGILAPPSPMTDKDGNPIPNICGSDAYYDSRNDVCIIIEKPVM